MTFAAELLLPGPLAHALFFGEALDGGGKLPTQLGLPAGMVQTQLADALLLPPLSDTAEDAETPGSAAVTLDAFQRSSGGSAARAAAGRGRAGNGQNENTGRAVPVFDPDAGRSRRKDPRADVFPQSRVRK